MDNITLGAAQVLAKKLGADPELVTAAVEAWLDAHPEATTTVEDGSITRAKLDQILQGIVDDVPELKSAIRNAGGYFDECINLFNPNDTDLVENYKLNNDGTTTAETGKFVSGFIPVKPGQTFCAHYPTGIYGSASSIVLYNSNKERIGYSNPTRTTDANERPYLNYSIPSDTIAVYMRMTGMMYNGVPGGTFYMYVYANEMPAIYVPYTDKVTLSDDVIVPFESIKGVSVSKDDTDFIKPELVNLVDFSAMIPGIIKNSTTDGGIDANSSWVTTDYIEVEPGATYALCIFPGVYYGAGFAGIPVYNDAKEQIARVKQPGGSISTIANRVTITIPDRSDAKYIRASYYKSYIDTSANLSAAKSWFRIQIFKASAWPTDMYIPFDDGEKLVGVGLENAESVKYNPLFGKSAMWNGDSICAADGDPVGGWPGRVATGNGMMFTNYGISGGTISENTGTNVHSVSATLDTMISDFPDADYIIIEGGTNDADILGSEGIGVFDADDFTAEYITALNKDTFSGALESIFYRLVTQMKGAHIGYLIPQKMGHTEVLVERRRDYFDRAVEICKKWGIPYLDLWNGLYFNWRLAAHWDQTMTNAQNEAAGNLYLDGQHLTTTGYAIESPIIAEWMRTF